MPNNYRMFISFRIHIESKESKKAKGEDNELIKMVSWN